jgi:hypothetical protein
MGILFRLSRFQYPESGNNDSYFYQFLQMFHEINNIRHKFVICKSGSASATVIISVNVLIVFGFSIKNGNNSE